MKQKLYLAVENLYDGGWGTELYITYSSFDKQKVVDYLLSKKYKLKDIDNYLEEIEIESNEKFYLGGYIE